MGYSFGRLFVSLAALLLWPLFSRAGAAMITLFALPIIAAETVIANAGTGPTSMQWARWVLVLLPVLIICWAFYQPAASQLKLDVLSGVLLFLRYILLVTIPMSVIAFFLDGLTFKGLLMTAEISLRVAIPLLLTRAIGWWLDTDRARVEASIG